MAAGDKSCLTIDKEILGEIFPHSIVGFEKKSRVYAKDEEYEFINEGCQLLNLSKAVRTKIWRFLDGESLRRVSQTCSFLQNEIYVFSRHENLRPTTFVELIYMLPFLPLRKYIDPDSWENLRLVCKEVQVVLDGIEEFAKQRRRWCLLSDLVELNHPAKNLVGGDGRIRKTIFDINTHDLKRIMSYLSEPDLKSLSKTCRAMQRLSEDLKALPFKEHKTLDFCEIKITDLPNLAQERIFQFCDPATRANLRLVSKLMRIQVDQLAGVTVHLNDRKWEWNPLCGRLPPANTLIVTHVEKMFSIQPYISDDNSRLLTKLRIDGHFPVQAMILIMERCKMLQCIELTYALYMTSIEVELKRSFPVRTRPIECPSLRSLNLKMREAELSPNNVLRCHSWSWENAFDLMRSDLVLMPNLTSFSICEEKIFSHDLMYEVAEKILKFLQAHRHTLRNLSIILDGSCFRDCDCPPFLTEIPDAHLEEIRLERFCYDCDWRISRPFTTILRAQKNLSELSMFKLSDWEFYVDIIYRNRLTLKSVKIEKNMSPFIDLSVFADCKKLEHLWISQCVMVNITRQYDYFINPRHLKPWGKFEPRLRRLDKLPKSLRSLHILDQTVETKQLRSIPARLKKLDTLEIQLLGSLLEKEYGLSVKCITEILQMRRLNSLFLEEVRVEDDLHFDHPIHDAVSKANLMPNSKVHMSWGCAMYAILIDEKLPSEDYKPDWYSRVEYHRNKRPSFASSDEQVEVCKDSFYNQAIRKMENDMFDEEEDNLYSNDSSDDTEDCAP